MLKSSLNRAFPCLETVGNSIQTVLKLPEGIPISIINPFNAPLFLLSAVTVGVKVPAYTLKS